MVAPELYSQVEGLVNRLVISFGLDANQKSFKRSWAKEANKPH